VALHSFSRGDIIWVNFPASNEEPDYVMTGRHRAIILSDDTLPNHTVIVSPVSSWIKKDKDGNFITDADGNLVYKKLERYNYGLQSSVYPEFLDHDSYIKLDQIITLTRETLDGEIIGHLLPDDLFQVDLRLMIVLDMLETLKRVVEQYVNQKTNAPK
jgi:mRNA-degrading endonuclease toxin of MazEF toxin-antitoxin module